MKNLSLITSILFSFLTTGYSLASSNNPIRLFHSNDYETIVKNKTKPFIMMFWSIDCPPCLSEMKKISNLSESEKRKFVFIATDGHELKNEISNLLHQLDLENQNNWVIKSNEIDLITSIIDKRWYGETPRSYYFDTNNQRTLLKNH